MSAFIGLICWEGLDSFVLIRGVVDPKVERRNIVLCYAAVDCRRFGLTAPWVPTRSRVWCPAGHRRGVELY